MNTRSCIWGWGQLTIIRKHNNDMVMSDMHKHPDTYIHPHKFLMIYFSISPPSPHLPSPHPSLFHTFNTNSTTLNTLAQLMSHCWCSLIVMEFGLGVKFGWKWISSYRIWKNFMNFMIRQEGHGPNGPQCYTLAHLT